MSEIHKEAALRRGEKRSAAIEARVRRAMVTIREEMTANSGIYPQNGGAISMNEVARRASISETTLFAPKHRELGKSVKAWVDSLKGKEVVGRMRVRRTLQERSEDWRKLFLALQDQHVGVELELQDAQVELEKVRKDLAELSEKYIALLQQMR